MAVEQAITVLKGHHSLSKLPEQARLRLQAEHANMSEANWCWTCQQYTSKKAKFCGQCGEKIAAQYMAQPAAATPWRDQGWQATQSWATTPKPPGSPRSRRTRSPRGGKNRPKGKGKETDSKGKGTSTLPQAVLPDLRHLPKPPTPPSLQPPSSSSLPLTDVPSPAQAKLDTLVAALKGASSSLPPDIVALVGAQDEVEHSAHSKAMHGAVSERTQAVKELSRIRSARRTFLSSWATYTKQLSNTLEKQVQQQAEALEQFASLEAKWRQQLQTASENLAKLTGDLQKIDSSDSDMSTGDGKVEQDPWKALELADQQKAQQNQLLEALSQARKAADNAVIETARDSSRTPRRHAKEAAEALATAADKTDKPVPGVAPT